MPAGSTAIARRGCRGSPGPPPRDRCCEPSKESRCPARRAGSRSTASASTTRRAARGAPILCIHGAGSSALAWAGAVEKLARLGRVIAYDRRGCGRSERPEPYERTTVGEHADDAAALLDALAPAPAVVVGRSFGGWVATELALRHPGRVRALVLLEPDAPGLSAAADAWVSAFAGRMRAGGGGRRG